MSDKKFFSLGLMAALAVSFLLSNAFADSGVYIEQEMQTKVDGEVTENEQVKIWISGDFVRFDSSRQPNYTVIDLKRSLMWVIDPKNKVYMEFLVGTDKKTGVKAEEFEVLQRFEKTGRVKKVGRWDCFEVEVFMEIKEPKAKETVKLKAGQTFMWLTESSELENEKLKGALLKSLNKWLSEPTSGSAQLKGLPVQVVTISEVESVGKKSIRETDVTVEEIKVIDVVESTFQIPAGYRKLGGAQ